MAYGVISNYDNLKCKLRGRGTRHLTLAGKCDDGDMLEINDDWCGCIGLGMLVKLWCWIGTCGNLGIDDGSIGGDGEDVDIDGDNWTGLFNKIDFWAAENSKNSLRSVRISSLVKFRLSIINCFIMRIDISSYWYTVGGAWREVWKR